MSESTKISQGSTYRRTQGPHDPNRSGSRPNRDKESKTSRQRDNSSSGDDGELCIICANKLKYVALSPCSHKTCHKCSFRQRALYGKKSCLICRTENEQLIFTELINGQYDKISNFVECNDQFGINFTSSEVARATLDLLNYNCPICAKDNDEINEHSNKTNFGGFKKYNEHLRTTHNKTICMICAVNKHAFPVELKIYTPNQLRNHQSKGDSEGFKGHPMCGFCSGKRFYSDDELYSHMRDQHEKCHICDKIDPSSPQYFKDYDQLFDHFKNCHYVCTVQSCLDNKFVVFRDELELQAHILKEHGDILRGKPKLFQSELSTFIMAPSRVIREGDSLGASFPNSSSRRNKSTNSNDSPEVKKLRLIERAKHYLGNSQANLDEFSRLNEDFDKGRLSAIALLNAYAELFKSPQADIYLLIHNFAETYFSNSSKFKELNAIYESHEQQIMRKKVLPSLSRDPSASTPMVNSIWSANNNSVSTSHGRNVNTSNLPTLKSPPPSQDPFGTTYKSHSYKSLNETRKGSPKPVTRTATSGNSVSITPNYLDRKQKSTSSPSLFKGRNKLAELDLPSLPTPKAKVHIPPVNRPNIPDPKQWGKPDTKRTDPTDEFTNLNLDLSSSNGKKKGKQKQLIFHIGI